MLQKIACKFWLILLSAIAVNGFCMEPPKRFGCHNFSSVEKIVNMESNNNELLMENFKQCMRNTRTYNEENLETAKKLQNDFEFAQKDSESELRKKSLASKWGVSCVFVGELILFCAALLLREQLVDGSTIICDIAIGGIAISSPLLVAYNYKQAQHVDIQKRERKEAMALHIKKFVDTLQKKNNNFTQDIQAAHQNK